MQHQKTQQQIKIIMITRIKTYFRERRERKLRKELYFLIRKHSISHNEDYAKAVNEAVDLILRNKRTKHF